MLQNCRNALIVLFMLAATSCADRDSVALVQSPHSEKEQTALRETRKFFTEHPEYLRSQENETKLFSEFDKITREEYYRNNENISMYQLLLLSHDRLSRQ